MRKKNRKHFLLQQLQRHFMQHKLFHFSQKKQSRFENRQIRIKKQIFIKFKPEFFGRILHQHQTTQIELERIFFVRESKIKQQQIQNFGLRNKFNRLLSQTQRNSKFLRFESHQQRNFTQKKFARFNLQRNRFSLQIIPQKYHSFNRGFRRRKQHKHNFRIREQRKFIFPHQKKNAQNRKRNFLPFHPNFKRGLFLARK